MLNAANVVAEDSDSSLRVYAVNIRTFFGDKSWTGYGIYLGRGLFITAAHVVGHAWRSNPKVVISDREYPTRVIKEGDFDQIDLTLLSVDENSLPMRLGLRRNPLCGHLPRPGESVITVVPEGVVRSHIIAPERLPIEARKFSTVIADVARTGNSGSGVFDAQRRCLLGIMSRKISQSRMRPDTGKTEIHDIAKYFVPASEIAAFLPSELRF